jgi:hypothetical protein
MRRLMLAGVFCAATTLSLVLLFPGAAWALPCAVEDIHFYSDATCTEMVGHFAMDCWGHATSHWGVQTAYAMSYEWCCGNVDCNDSDPANLSCGGYGYAGCMVTNCPESTCN